MPYALFSNDARLSKAYPTEADVWKVARTSGLVVDVATEEEKANPHPVLDNHEIRPCDPEPNEDPARNKLKPRATSTEPQPQRIAGEEASQLLISSGPLSRHSLGSRAKRHLRSKGAYVSAVRAVEPRRV